MITGYVVWLVAYSIGKAVATVSVWGLVVLILSAAAALGGALWGRQLRRRGNYALASFVFALPVLPVLLSVAVLADSYL